MKKRNLLKKVSLTIAVASVSLGALVAAGWGVEGDEASCKCKYNESLKTADMPSHNGMQKAAVPESKVAQQQRVIMIRKPSSPEHSESQEPTSVGVQGQACQITGNCWGISP